MSSIYLNLAGPLQSWAGPSVLKTRVDTKREPSERAIRGLLMAAFGVPRGKSQPEEISDARIEISTLNQGRVVRDFQIVGDRSDEELFLERLGRIFVLGNRAWGGHASPDSRGMNKIVNRTYLGDAQFIVKITGKTEEETFKIFSMLQKPTWDLYLGKKAFPATFPFLLGVFSSEEEAMARLKEIEDKQSE